MSTSTSVSTTTTTTRWPSIQPPPPPTSRTAKKAKTDGSDMAQELSRRAESARLLNERIGALLDTADKGQLSRRGWGQLMTGMMLHINDEEIQGFYEESYLLVTSYVRKSRQPPQQQQQQMQMPHPRPVMHQQQQMAPVQPVLQQSPHQFEPVYQSSPSFQPVLQQIPPQPYQHFIQATPQPPSTPTSTATATSTSGNSQVGACGQMWDTGGPSAPAGATARSDNNDSFGLGNISFGSSLVQAVESPSGSLLSSLASASADGDGT